MKQSAEQSRATGAVQIRFFVGDVADGYLQKAGPTAGYSVVIFRGRHVGAPHEMAGDEHAAFWTEVGAVATAIERVYRPIHLNFQILGNQDPHVHVHIVPRHDPDPRCPSPLRRGPRLDALTKSTSPSNSPRSERRCLPHSPARRDRMVDVVGHLGRLHRAITSSDWGGCTSRIVV